MLGKKTTSESSPCFHLSPDQTCLRKTKNSSSVLTFKEEVTHKSLLVTCINCR